MILRVLRFDATPTRTIGVLIIDGAITGYTLEDAVRTGPKVPGSTAIPTGVYEVAMTFSPHFQKALPLLQNVPRFEGIRIHGGNTDADTRGCLLVGTSRGGQNTVLGSQTMLAKVVQLVETARLRGERVWCSVETVRAPQIPVTAEAPIPPGRPA